MTAGEAPIFRDGEADLRHRARGWSGRVALYAALVLWALVCLLPIYWTVSTSLKQVLDLMQGRLVPWAEFRPSGEGWAALGLGSDATGAATRLEVTGHVLSSLVVSLLSSALALVLGSLAGYGLSRFPYRWAGLRNEGLGLFVLGLLLLPPLGLALPLLAPFEALRLRDTRVGLVLLYATLALPLVIWIMRGQFARIPTQIEEAARLDGLSTWGTFLTVVLPMARPGLMAAFLLSLVLTWNEHVLAALLTSGRAGTLPVLLAAQSEGQGIAWPSMAALSTVAILPPLLAGVVLERFVLKGMPTGAVP